MKDEERLAMVKSCKWVDEVVFGVPYSPSIELLDSLQCDFAVHGDDMPTDANGESAYESLLKAGRCKIIKRTEGISTTDLVGRLLWMTREHHLESDRYEITHQRQFLPTTQRIYQFSKFADSRHVNNMSPQSIVYVAGAFDLFHIGHLELLKEAKKMGDFLLVGIHDDKMGNRIRGKNFPIMNLHERALNVLSCKYVDEIVLGAPYYVTKEMISTMNIKIVVAGNVDYSEELMEADDPYSYSKSIHSFVHLHTSQHLTTETITERILSNRSRFEELYQKKKNKQDNYIHQSLQYRTVLKEL